MSDWITELQHAALFGAAFAILLGAAEAWRRGGKAAPETTRKLVHFVGGLLCIGIPFLFRSLWTVLALAGTLAAFIAAGSRFGFLKSLHGVSRKTRGSEYYPLAIFLLWIMAGEQRWLYVCAVLVLTTADAAAALVGTRYGSLRYEVEDGQKSVEGSLFFCLIAFLSLHLPMLLMTDLPRETCVLAALLVALLVTGFEAVSLGGTDNLFVPVGALAILAKITTKPVPEVVYQTVSLGAVVAVIALAVRLTRSFNVGGTVAFALFTFGAWSLGSEAWALPILVGFGVYMLAWVVLPQPPANRGGVRVRTVFRALLVPLLLLVADNMFVLDGRLYLPFVAALAAILGMALWNHVMIARAPAGWARVLLAVSLGAGSGAVVAAAPAALAPDSLPGAATVVALAAAAAIANDRLQGLRPRLTQDSLWDATRILATLGAAIAALVLQESHTIRPWNFPAP